MKRILLLAFAFVLIKCAGTHKMTASTVEFTEIHNYMIRNIAPLPDSINYLFITKEEEFNKFFAATKSVPGKAFVPDFEKDAIVAIILSPSQRVTALQINTAETAGETLTIHYTSADTTGVYSYPHTPVVIGRVPKDNAITKVSFYKGKMKERTLTVVN